jgi:hypothetical protein
MRVQRYRVVLFEPGSGRQIGERRILAQSDQDAAECLCGTILDRVGGMSQLHAQVAPVDKPVQRQMFYATAPIGKPDLVVVYAYQTLDSRSRLPVPSRFKATLETIKSLGAQALEGSEEVVPVSSLDERGECCSNGVAVEALSSIHAEGRSDRHIFAQQI